MVKATGDASDMITRMKAGEYLLSPADAECMRDWDFTHFRTQVPLGQWVGYDREAWQTRDRQQRAWPELLQREDELLQRASTPFAEGLRRAERRAEPVLEAVADLYAMLRDMAEDDEPATVEVYLRHTRGVQLVPEGVEIPNTDVDNYRPQTELLRGQRTVELKRHRTEGFTETWAQLRATHGDRLPVEPNNILPVNVQPKNEKVGRVTFDPSNAGEAESSVNDNLPTPPCCLPKMQHGAAAMSRYGLAWREDDSDAFLMHPLQPESMQYCAYREETGTVCALQRMGLGFTNAPAIQQDTMVANLRAFRRKLRRRGLTTAGNDPRYGKPWEYVKPGRGHQLTAALGYVDDVLGQCTSRESAWFSFMHYLLHKRDWRNPVGTAVGKTDPPATEVKWIGYLYRVRQMQVALDEERLVKMREDLKVFTDISDRDARAGVAQVTARDLDHTLGVLEFGGNVILLGKAYFREIRLLRTAMGPKAHPSAHTNVSWAVCSAMWTWSALTHAMSARSAFIGARRRTFPHAGYSDASFGDPGWCWHVMGTINFGSWPVSWKERMGHHSVFRDIWIGELELWALLLMVRMVAPRARGTTLKLWCDNLGVVYMVNKLGTRSERCSRLVNELVWLAVVYDLELSVDHIATHENVLADAGTRQEDKEFKALAREYLAAHPDVWMRRERQAWPRREPARPELSAMVPVVHAGELAEMEVSAGDMGRLLPEFLRLGAAPRRAADVRAHADDLLQVLATQIS